MVTDSLMSFRTTWLRAVAHAWSDKSFKAKLLKDPMKTMGELELEWPWPDTLHLKVSEGTGFQWIGDEWTWPNNSDLRESLTLYVPLKPPEKIRPDEHAIALADYYDMRPTLFGTSNSLLSQLDGCSFQTSSVLAAGLKSAPAPVARTVFSSQQQPTNGFIPSETDFPNFEVALISVMAKAWENENFRNLVETDEDASDVVSVCRGYVPPWSLTLKIRHDKSAVWGAPKGKGKSAKQSGNWSKLTPHVLRLNLPETPRDPKECSLALAAYNATGAEFPFTCCV